MKVTITRTQMLDDKVYFPGEDVEVPDDVGKRLNEQMEAQRKAIEATGNEEAAPMTKEAEGPDVNVGEPLEKGSKRKSSKDED
jgi:hypothetical protein